MLEKLKNIKKIGLFITILSFISSIVLLRDVNNLDEIWNFNFARCFANGLVAYKDFVLFYIFKNIWARNASYKNFGYYFRYNNFIYGLFNNGKIENKSTFKIYFINYFSNNYETLFYSRL